MMSKEEQYLQRQISRLKKQVCCIQEGGAGAEQIFVAQAPLTGPAPEGFVYGIDNSTGNTYYVNDLNQWELMPSPKDDLLDNVTDFASFDNPSAERIGVINVERGGDFNRYVGALAVDGGTIFQDAAGNKWKREIDDKIEVPWFLAAAGTDVTPLWNTIMQAATDNKVSKIYFPTKVGNYVFSDEILIDRKLEVYGPTNYNLSYLSFAANKRGIVTNYVGSRDTYIHDLLLSGGTSSSPGTPHGVNWVDTAHGIFPMDIVRLENVTVRYFGGNGFHFYGNSGTSNVNNSRLQGCYASQNRLHGFFFEGADANAIEITKCDATANGGAGIMDLSFLGNHYRTFHSSSNSSPEVPWQRSLVKVGTNVYTSKVNGLIGVEPEVTVGWATSWELITIGVWDAYGAVKVYDPARTYHIGGQWYLSGAAQYSTMMSCYAEMDQPPAFTSARILTVGSNAIYRGTTPPAVLNAHDNKLYSFCPISVGAPYWTSQTRAEITQTAFTLINGTKKAIFSMSPDGLSATLSSTGTTLGIVAAGMRFSYGFGMNFMTSRNRYGSVDLNAFKPLTAPGSPVTNNVGAMVLHNNMDKPLNEDFGETISYKYTDPTSYYGNYGNLKWYRTVGEFEWEVQTTNATALNLISHAMAGIGAMKTIIRAVALDPVTGDVFSMDRIYLHKRGTPPTLLSVTDLTTTYRDIGLAGVDCYIDIFSSSIYFNIIGKAATTLNWKVRVNRLLVT